MTKGENSKQYDLEDRTLQFAKEVRQFVKRLPRSIANREDGEQVIRSSGSMGANYIEVNEALSKKDFVMRIKICRKESKETIYWLSLVDTSGDDVLDRERTRLKLEAKEMMMIFGSIMRRSE